ncbi:MAG: alpha/beta hydrolase [Microbacteriaceae bacterium]|nr:alpha/beta hydrolase [Microbacteriaceae bacterium]
MDSVEFRLLSGRAIGVSEFGRRSSETVVVLAHPAPGSSRFDPDPAVTNRRNVRLIAVDRPGYGTSELLADGGPGTVTDAASDIAEYLAFQGITRVGAVGWSAGGRVVLALAAVYSALVGRLAVVATPAPDEEVPWVGTENRERLGELSALPAAAAVTALSDQLAKVVGERPSADALLRMLSSDEADARLREQARDRLAEMLDRAAMQGTTGMAADIVSYTLLDWGFDPASVAAKTLLLYGGADQITGAHGRWYQKRIPHSRLETVKDVGHLLVVPMWDRILSHVAPGSKMNGR